MIYYYLGEAKILQIASGWRGSDVAFVKNNSLRNSGRPGQVNVLCSWARYFTLSECFSPQKISYLHEVNSWNLRTTSHYYQQQSFSGLQSPGQSDYTITCYLQFINFWWRTTTCLPLPLLSETQVPLVFYQKWMAQLSVELLQAIAEEEE